MEDYISSLSTEQKNLLEAVQKRTLADVTLLLKQFPNLIADARFSYVLLVASLRRGHKSISLLLMRKKCCVKSSFKTNYYSSPLFYAVRQNDTDIFEVLYKRGASICAVDANIETPLELAMEDHRPHFWNLIKDKLSYDNLDPNCQEHIAVFHAACYKGSLGIMKKFVERKFSVNSRSHFLQGKWAGATALQFALKGHKNTHEIVKYLLKLDVDFNIQDEQGDTPILSTVTVQLDPFNPDDDPVNEIFKEYVRRLKYFSNPVNKLGLSHFHLLCSLDWHHSSLKNYDLKHMNVLRHFIKNRVDINSANQLKSGKNYGDAYYAGYTALHWAAQKSSVKVLELLLENGADPTRIDANGKTPLHVLEFKNPDSVEMTKLLLKYGADVDIKDSEGYTPLQNAFHTRKRNESLMQLLWSNSRQTVDHTDPCGLSYLHIASTRDLEKVKTLVNNGACVRSCLNSELSECDGYSPLHFAVMYNKVDIVEYLLTEGAAVDHIMNTRTVDTPLYLACTEQLKYFYGADDNIYHLPNAINSIPPIHEANDWVSSRKNQMRIIELLLENGSSVNYESYKDQYPLGAACELPISAYGIAYTYTKEYQDRILEEITLRRKLMIDMLLRYGANINLQGEYSEPIFDALYNKSFASHWEKDIAEFLLEKGAHVDDRDDEGFTPLHSAVIKLTCVSGSETFARRDSSFIDLFLKYGANVNSKSNKDDSILHSSVKHHHLERIRHRIFIKLLDQSGIDLNARNTKGDTPLHLAVRLRKDFCVENLLNAGADINIENADGHSPAYVLQKILEDSRYPLDKSEYSIYITVTEYLKKLAKLNYFISEKNELCLATLSRVSNHTKVDSEIDAEVLKLKSVKIDNYTSLCTILMKNPNDIANHVKNKVFEEIVSSTQLENYFPLFCHFLKRQYKKGLARSLVLEPAKKALRNVSRINWTDYCSEEILRHLSSDDLENLIKCKPIDNPCKRSSKDSANLGRA